jgi:histidinol-phosphate aminotransferase
MKNWLYDIERKFDTEDKSKYLYVLNQSERTEKLDDTIFQNFLNSLQQDDFFFYPNTKYFKERLCEFYNTDYNNLFLCAGSDLGIRSVIETFLEKEGQVISSVPCFPMYQVYTKLYQGHFIGIEHEKDYTVLIEKMISRITNNTNLILLANPNSPMGEYKDFNEIKSLLEYGIPVLIDEAYIEFSTRISLLKYLKHYPNLIITRTFSKAMGAAGCRVGMVFASPDYIDLISKFRSMYEISSVSLKYCDFLINNYELVLNYVKKVRSEKRNLL